MAALTRYMEHFLCDKRATLTVSSSEFKEPFDITRLCLEAVIVREMTVLIRHVGDFSENRASELLPRLCETQFDG
jgi:hypothetical protein